MSNLEMNSLELAEHYLKKALSSNKYQNSEKLHQLAVSLSRDIDDHAIKVQKVASEMEEEYAHLFENCLLYTSPSPRDS